MTYSIVELTGKGPYYTQIENGTRRFLKNMSTDSLPRKGEYISLKVAPYTEGIFRVKTVEHSDIGHPHVYVKKVSERKY
ncbi:hypothetical protein SEA_TUNATARTARE_246 [Streptomyces phage TunaTartare]|uniref:Uncharacterized protein n=1 Tax=Streptomyces phage TunaTartare TaxID=2848887 RepID=A0A8F2E6V6_9CAUD|nr:hypothetical protein PP457_gp034 [Streptomyces phage TunaTartare]QWT30108.1 hypothetical protein SEA_TUNATARTARE_246 [Streptomyces phage TunaTartare]